MNTSAQCVWHFNRPVVDTSDSDATAGVSHCDAASFHLDDGALEVDVDRDGLATVAGVNIGLRDPGSTATAWCTQLFSAEVDGLICVNLR